MPSRTVRNFGFPAGPPRLAPATKVLLIITVLLSLAGSITQQKLGYGVGNLSLQVDAVLRGELWRLITYPFVESSPWNLILSLLFLWLLGSWFENRWGPRDFVRFFLLASIGAGVLAIPLSLLFDAVLPFRDVGMSEGPNAALDAMLVALALTAPDSNVMLGFVLPVRARTIVFVILGIEVIFGIQTGAAALSVTLGGMAMGYLLVTGRWRPNRWLALARRSAARRRGLYVVPPRDHTLH